jgi:hypothetical protein
VHQLHQNDAEQISISIDRSHSMYTSRYEVPTEEHKFADNVDRKLMYSYQRFSFIDDDSSFNRTTQLAAMNNNGSSSSVLSSSVESGLFGDEEYKMLKKGNFFFLFNQ